MNHPVPDEALRKRAWDRALLRFLHELVVDSWRDSPVEFLKAVGSFALIVAMLTAAALVVPGLMLSMVAFVCVLALLNAFGAIAECWRDKDYPLARSGMLVALCFVGGLALSLAGLWWYAGKPDAEIGS